MCAAPQIQACGAEALSTVDPCSTVVCALMDILICMPVWSHVLMLSGASLSRYGVDARFGAAAAYNPAFSIPYVV